ncbi:MAG: DUF262 domain-containing protein [Anaerolineae bacterium]
MKADDITLHGILTPTNQYAIPVFQRYYSWERKDWQKLWEDLVELQEPEANAQTHFMGSLVFVAEEHFPNKVPVFQVIDGQQRLITMTLLLAALRNTAKAHGFDDLASEISNTFLVHPYKSGREHMRVYPRQRDRDQYIGAIKGSESVDGRVGEALRFFEQQILSLPSNSNGEGLHNLFGTLQARLQFVYIQLQNENPYQVFKSLNSTGVDLSEADLIRNFMFMHVKLEDQDGFDDYHWKPLEKRFEDETGRLDVGALSAFFRDFLMSEGKYVPTSATFQQFEQSYQGSSFQPTALAETLAHDAKLYDILRGRQKHPDLAVDAALEKLRRLDSSTAYPLVLNLMRRVENGKMTIADLRSAVELLSGFVLRRYVVGESSRGYSRWFVSACTNLGDNPLAGLRSFLLSKGFPSDEVFTEALIQYPLYKSYYTKTVLVSLERAKGHKEIVELADVQVEHIMPQTLSGDWKADLGPNAELIHDRWLHTIGNLTLTGYNSELSNDTFSFKRKDYKNSNIEITRDLADYEKWTETEIETRGKALAAQVASIWRGP